MRLITPLSPWLLGALLLLNLAACGSFPAMGLPSQQQAAAPPAAAQLLGKAQEAEARGDFVGAMQLYMQLAEVSQASTRQDYQLSAAAAALRAGNISQARGLVNAVESGGLDAKLSARRQLLDGEIALSEGNPQQALDALAHVTDTNLTPSVLAQAHLLRAEAFSVMGNQLESARERVLLEPLLTDPIAVRDNQNAIVQALSGLSDQVLQQLGATPPDVLSGWMELVLIARTTPGPGQYNERVIDWRHRYRQHPATQDLVAALPKQRLPLTGAPGQTVTPEIAAPLQTSPAIAQDYPQQIALLLPLSGKLANVGMAVRDAFQAAASTTSGNAQPVIRVYDVAAINTEAEGTKVLQVYQQAVQEGAAFVVGPLEKEGVKALYTLGALPVPTLALNYNEDVTTPLANLYQFGLLPEDEARQAAERAWLDGHSRALALVPAGEWGERMLNAFTSHLEQLGGIVVDSQSYPADEVDFAKPVRKLLKYSGGKQHRQDADYIFLAAQPRQGRGIRPQLQFFFASDLPVYATSHIYAGKPNRAADQDLDGIAFADMPWVIADFTPQQALRQSLAAAHAGNFEQLKRLYALGVDAYNVIPYLNSLHSAAEQRYAGETGTLRLDENNRLHRQLLWARFAGGEAQVMDSGAAR